MAWYDPDPDGYRREINIVRPLPDGTGEIVGRIASFRGGKHYRVEWLPESGRQADETHYATYPEAKAAALRD